MKKISLKTIYKTLLVSCLITTFSCKKTFDKLPQNTVDVKNAYQNVYDANAAVIGIYGKFMTLADRYIVLNELRADLVSPTINADIYLKQLDEHTETTDNPWADPKPWYSLIMNINDAMAHFDDMYKTGRLSVSDYQERYSDIGALRCFLYLELGIQYGDQVRYVTDPLATLDDLKDESKYPKIKFKDLLTKLVDFMGDDKRYMGAYSQNNPITGSTNSSLNVTVDGNATSLFFINKYVLKGDLNLWAGNYNEASQAYKRLIDLSHVGYDNASVQYYERFKVVAQELDLARYSTGGMSISYQSPGGTPNPSQVEASLWDSNTAGWREIFGDPGGSTNISDEWIWVLPFTANFAPVDPFIDLFSNRGGKYLLKPSQRMMDLWDGAKTPDAIETNGYPYDARSRLAVKTLDGQPVIMKFLYYYLTGSALQPVNPLQKTGRWTLSRGGSMNQHFAEAALNDNQQKIGYALYNEGITDIFRPDGDSDSRNAITNLPFPYDMDARSGGPTGFLGEWYRQNGTRTRAKLIPQRFLLNGPKEDLENAIILENARELSFEGYRWGDLVRIAIRRNDPDFLASKVRDKLIAEGNPGAAAAAYTKLMTKTADGDYGFYMPFKL